VTLWVKDFLKKICWIGELITIGLGGTKVHLFGGLKTFGKKVGSPNWGGGSGNTFVRTWKMQDIPRFGREETFVGGRK